MKKGILIFICLFTMYFCITTATTIVKTENLCEKFVRVHVIANSDSAFDQGIKIAVRDYIFEKYKNEFASFDTKEKTLKFIKENSEIITKDVNAYLDSVGCDYTSFVTADYSEFPKKEYGNIVLPKGRYDSFKIILGEGKGKNFFCVMFPPMCVDEGVSTGVKLDDITDEKEKEMLSKKVVYKLRILELFK